MKIDEFIKEVNKVAHAEYDDDIGEIWVYEYKNANAKDWFLELRPQHQDLVGDYSLAGIGVLDIEGLTRVLDLAPSWKGK